MSRAKQTEQFLAEGLVLNDKWDWVPLVDKISKEREFLGHLMAGEVLIGGRWMSIQEARFNQLKESSYLPETKAFVSDHPLRETRVIPPVKIKQPPIPEHTTGYAPETVFGEIDVSVSESPPVNVDNLLTQSRRSATQTLNPKARAALAVSQSLAWEESRKRSHKVMLIVSSVLAGCAAIGGVLFYFLR